jgi:hypothetical protein
MLLISILFGFLFSTLMVFGLKLTEYGNIDFRALAIYLEIISAAPFFAALLCFIFYYYPMFIDKLSRFKIPPYERFTKSKYFFYDIWAFIFVFYFVTLVLYFPGVANYDAISQISIYLNGKINDVHPIASTYLFGLFTTVGLRLFNSLTGTVFLYSLFQALLASYIFAYVITNIIKFKIPLILQILIIIYYSINYIIVFAALEMGKDTIFSLFFLLLILEIVNIILIPCYQTNKKILKIIVYILITAAFRHNAVYAYAVFFPFLLLFIIQKQTPPQIQHALIITVTVFTLLAFYKGPVYKILNIKKSSDFQAASSLMFQQVARVMRYNSDALDAHIKEQIIYLIPNVDNYDPYYVDFIRVDNRVYNEKAFVELWIKLGLKFPATYINAFLDSTYICWFPDKTRDYRGKNWQININDTINRNAVEIFLKGWDEFSRLPEIPKLAGEINSNINNTRRIDLIPVFSLFTRLSIYSWILLVYLGFCILYKKYKFILPFIFISCLILTILVAPLVCLRYFWSIIFSMPIFIAVISSKDYFNATDLTA